jgi:ferritin heavy chain
MQPSFPLEQQCVTAIMEQIAKELEASYAYQAIALHFEHPDVAFSNVAKFFHDMSAEELGHAKLLQGYVLKRGIRPTLRDLKAFNPDKTLTLLQAFELALRFEQNVFTAIRSLHDLGAKAGDAHLTMFVEDVFFEEQIQSEREISAYLAVIKRLGSGVGEFLFDRHGLNLK